MDVITRLAALLIAILLAIDAYSGERTESLRVDRHSRTTSWRHDDSYRLHFVGGRVESCEVGWSVFNALNDGDDVSVDTSRVFKSCDGIRRGGDVISESHSRKWFMLLPIGIMLAAAFGWIQFERRVDDDTRGWWFG
jgi:hypothetical protein